MIERKLLGDKTGGGFYKKQKGADGEQRLAIDWKTLEYRPAQSAKFPSLEMAKNVDSLGERLAMLLRRRKDKANLFLWRCSPSCSPTRPTASRNRRLVVEIDRAMRLGYNWEMGPFELWDAAGVADGRAHEAGGQAGCGQRGEAARLRQKSWYTDLPKTASGRAYFDLPPATIAQEESSRRRLDRDGREEVAAWSRRTRARR